MGSAVRDLVREVSTVASPPGIYDKLMQVMNHPRSSAQDIAGVIGDDPGLTSRLLRLVNSALFSFPRRIDTVSQAVTVVGTSQIRDLALATSVMALFKDVPEDVVTMRSFWEHSLACAAGARVIATRRREGNVERYFLAGILHDVGHLIIYMRRPQEAREALEITLREPIPLYEAERRVLNYDHAKVGYALLEAWNLPLSLMEAVGFHHQPIRARQFPGEAAAVHLADILSHALCWGSSGEHRVPPLSEDAWSRLGLQTHEVTSLVQETERQLETVVRLIDAVEA